MSDKALKIGTNGPIKVTACLCYIFGIWPKDNSSIIYTIYGYTFHALTTFGWTTTKCIGTVFLEDKKEIILFTASSMYCVVSAYRVLIIMRKSNCIDFCLNALAEFSLDKMEYERIQHKMKKFSTLASTYTIFVFGGLVSAFLNPVLSVERVLPAPIWLPYIDWNDNDIDLCIALVFSVIGILAMVIACTFTPIIIWHLIYGSSLMLEVLGGRLQSLGYKRENDAQVFGDLLECIESHQEIVENIKKFEDTFASVFLLQITSSAICICSVAYLMASESISENFNNFAMYFSLTGIYTFEIFVVVYFANEIALANDRLSYHIYESDWTSMSMKCRKTVMVIGEKWRKPKQLVVGKVFVMSMNLLSSILNVAYSILNVLRKDQS